MIFNFNFSTDFFIILALFLISISYSAIVYYNCFLSDKYMNKQVPIQKKRISHENVNMNIKLENKNVKNNEWGS